MKSFIPTKKESLKRTSYQTNKRSNIILNNIGINLDKEEDIPIFDKDLTKDKIKYNQIQYQLKLILCDAAGKSCGILLRATYGWVEDERNEADCI